MAIADRLNKLRTDIEDTYQAINEIGGTIPSNKNTNNIPEAIRSVYDNLPKVTDTGTNVSLSPTLKGRLGIVQKGNTLQDGTPTPDTPVEIQSATGTQKVVVSGKNLFDIDNNVLNAYINATGYVLTSSSNMKVAYAPCKPNTTYTISKIKSARFVVASYSNLDFGAGSTNGRSDNDATSITLTTDANAKYICVFYYHTSDTISEETIRNSIQIEANSTATPYQPYQEPQEVDIDLGDIELNKIGDYEDYIDGTPDNWVLYKNIGKVVLNGSENWLATSQTTITDKYRNAIKFGTITNNNYINVTNNNEIGKILCNRYIPTISNSGGTYGAHQGISLSTGGDLYIYDDIYNTNDVTLFKTYLSTHNTEILYVLAEETTTPITEEPLVSQLNELYYLQSYNDTTNIDVTGNLPMRITASAIKGA